jgi:hypothetical protein
VIAFIVIRRVSRVLRLLFVLILLVRSDRKTRFSRIVVFEPRLRILMLVQASIGKELLLARIRKVLLLLRVERMGWIESRSGMRTGRRSVISYRRATARQFTQGVRQFAACDFLGIVSRHIGGHRRRDLAPIGTP